MDDDGFVGLRAAVDALGEFSRGVTNGAGSARDEGSFAELAEQCARNAVAGRVLIVADGQAAEAIEFVLRDGRDTLAWPGRWEDLDPLREGTFGVVCCEDVLQRALDPMALLLKLRTMLIPGGTLLIGSMLLADPERSEYLRFTPTGHAGNLTWRFIPGRLAFSWMLQAAGFEVEDEFGEREGPRESFPLVHAFLRARAIAVAET